MVNKSKAALIILMTNRSRSWAYRKASQEITGKLNTSITEEIFIDTSWVEDLKEGERLLHTALNKINSSFKFIILIKDSKWSPAIKQIKARFKRYNLYIAEIDIQATERFTEAMDARGFINYLVEEAFNQPNLDNLE